MGNQLDYVVYLDRIIFATAHKVYDLYCLQKSQRSIYENVAPMVLNYSKFRKSRLLLIRSTSSTVSSSFCVANPILIELCPSCALSYRFQFPISNLFFLAESLRSSQERPCLKLHPNGHTTYWYFKFKIITQLVLE